MSHPNSGHPVEPPGPIKLPLAARAVAGLAALAGAGLFAWQLSHGHAALAWSAYLIGAFFALGLGVFGLIWLATLNLTGAVWSVTMRRIPEAMCTWLLPGGALALAVGLGGHSLYHWTDIEAVALDPLLSHKAPFLNMTMFYALTGVSILAWIVLSALMLSNSRKQDKVGGVALSKRNRALSAISALVFALTISVVSFYLLMSLDAHWFSTMFAVLVFTDVIQTGTAFVAIIAGTLILKGQLKGFLNEHHLHSLGKMIFASTGFWAYIAFCQFLLIWYANVPEETIYYLKRWENGWLPYLLILPALKFVIPFIVMVPRAGKRSAGRVIAMSVLIIFAQFWELLLMVSPAIGHGEHLAHGHLPLVEGVIAAGFVGLFYLVFEWSLARHPAVPLKDPGIQACLDYHS